VDGGDGGLKVIALYYLAGGLGVSGDDVATNYVQTFPAKVN
jgi:uncharacterized protein GlcG (DUF336 family)